MQKLSETHVATHGSEHLTLVSL